MKLRIRGNSIRLRLTKTEVFNLAEQGLIEETTDFGEGNCLVYAISDSNKIAAVKVNFADNRLEIVVPASIAKNWANNEEVGISAQQGLLKVLIEKDFTCLVPRNTPEDADTFPHPKDANYQR
jgi:hypothetical protein